MRIVIESMITINSVEFDSNLPEFDSERVESNVTETAFDKNDMWQGRHEIGQSSDGLKRKPLSRGRFVIGNKGT